MKNKIEIKVNGESRGVEVDPETPLLWVLREQLGLTGSKYGCGAGHCGACTVHLDGRAQRSCVFPVHAVAGAEVTTIEGLGMFDLHPVQAAWLEHQVPQCGYCQPGMIMAIVALLNEHPQPTKQLLREAIGNICRCGTYARIRQAVLSLGDDW